jgi:hypothetical protein
MTTFLDRFEDELLLAHERRGAAASPAAAPRRTRRRLGLLACVLVLLGGAATATAVGLWQPRTREQSAVLVARPPLPRVDPADTDLAQRLTGSALEATAHRIAAGIPLPPGAAFRLARWASAGAMSVSGVRSGLEYEASCSWYRFWVAGTTAERGHALAVLRDIPRWPTFRGNETGARAAALTRAASRGDAAPLRRQLAINCG